MPSDRLPTAEARGQYGEASAVEAPLQLDALQEPTARFAPHVWPIGDRCGNRALFTAAGGNADQKLAVLITDMLNSLPLRRAADPLGPAALDPDVSRDTSIDAKRRTWRRNTGNRKAESQR